MRILFVTSTRIGDAVLTSGLLHHLVTAHPGAAVTVACGPPAAPLFEAVPGLERLIVMAKKPYAGHWFRLWALTVGRHWDRIADTRGSPITALIPHRWRRSWRSMKTPEHRVMQFSRLIGLETPAAPYLYVDPRHTAAAAKLIPDGGPVLALGPTANWRGKEWPIDRFIELARRLTAPQGPLPGARIAVFGAPNERAAAEPLLKALAGPGLIDLAGRTELMTAFACLCRARVYIGNDSGLMHMAAASGTPTLGLFGPSPEIHYAPYGLNCAVVRTPESCAELMPPGFDVNISHTLMGNLTIDAVEAAARALIARTAPRVGPVAS
jgi:ADP-heptose:LPS heptosyltransferase